MAMKIEKIAEGKKKEGRPGLIGAAGLGAGALTTRISWLPLTGRKKVYHATLKERLKGIKREGIRPKYSTTGAIAAKGIKGLKGIPEEALGISGKLAKGGIYVTADPRTARMMAYIRDPDLWAALGFRRFKKGKILRIAMDYDKWKRMKPDVEFIREFSRRIPKGMKDPTKVREEIISALDPEFYEKAKIQAARGTQRIEPSEILDVSKASERAKRVFRKSPKYIKKYPRRFSKGLVGAIAGLAAMGYGGKKVYQAIKKPGVNRNTDK